MSKRQQLVLVCDTPLCPIRAIIPIVPGPGGQAIPLLESPAEKEAFAQWTTVSRADGSVLDYHNRHCLANGIKSYKDIEIPPAPEGPGLASLQATAAATPPEPAADVIKGGRKLRVIK